MSNIIELISELKRKEVLYKEYLTMFLARFIYGSTRIDDTRFESSEVAMQIATSYQALEYLINNIDNNITLSTIKMTYEIMNENLSTYVPGFRKFDVIVDQGNIIPSEPWAIPSNLSNLLYNYYNVWNELDPYEREARFHIEFCRIQPFEDGNKRTARMLMAINLIKNNCAPAIIGLDKNEEYLFTIKKRDYKTLATIIKNASLNEKNLLENLYDRLNNQLKVGEDKVYP